MFRKIFTSLLLGTTLVCAGTPAFAASYQVKAGDTLWKLAHRDHLSLKALEQANPHVNPRNLQIGQTIHIPDRRTVSTYTVHSNDTFWSISQALHMSVGALEAANPKVDPLNLYPGLVLHLPQQSATPSLSNTNGNRTLARSLPARGSQGQTVVTASGQKLQVAREIDGVATAYTASTSSNGSWGAVDYFGNPLHLGKIAVDPNVIPLGSKVYVTGYTFDGLPAGGMICTASDVGGGVKGSHIDIFIPTSDGKASAFGIQHVKMYLLK
jgi:LysM repeat protein